MARAPFLDKFATRRERTNSRDSLEHVMRNIEAVLNTKKGYGFFMHDFGLGGYTEKLGTRELVEALTAEIQQEVTQHEPRLVEPEVKLRGRDSSLWLYFDCKGTFNGQPCHLSLLFHSTTGRVRVQAEDT
ncbi:type VI secretion system baseplate subunit TssE [Corallococcus sp. AB004]|uniref:GPW/gp25 family protein n=1 Tax=Corallococcus TaxID=83461 RepID=UPI000EA17A49|nr:MULTISPECIES: GPW/gp25 family protein [Corallococcus]RKI32901.1 type VI secretion system baseplate subunit TssE [Corallococcus sp. AB004]MBN8468138.1 GPW/gp25 family protein [Corallococcus exiguus]NPC72835.1 GPW/gp25 family protein [Corallococcus exiguus]NPD27072.1 GPW/gp25 family protein [Corallococcus exiguus]NRD50931.1 GPW/gp25 family protein [Corallococcus exiguus]